MRSQLERMFSLIYREERRCMDCLAKLKKEADGKARISPREAAEEIFATEEIFKGEIPNDQILCFILLASLENELVQEVIEGLGKRGDGAISVDEALLILNDKLDELCRYCRAQTIKFLENSMRRKKEAGNLV